MEKKSKECEEEKVTKNMKMKWKILQQLWKRKDEKNKIKSWKREKKWQKIKRNRERKKKMCEKKNKESKRKTMNLKEEKIVIMT